MTGCCSGVGASLRTALLAERHEVFGVGLQGPDLYIDFCSLEFAPTRERFFARLESAGPFDTLVNNAGLMELAPFPDYTAGQLERSWRVNVEAPFALMQKFYKMNRHREAPHGGFRIVNTTSMAPRVRPPRQCPGYVATKAALEALTRALATELAEDERWILCCIAPASIENTAMQRQGLRHLVERRGMTLADAEAYQRSSMMGRAVRHEEMVAVLRFALNDMPAAMSGTVLTMPLASV